MKVICISGRAQHGKDTSAAMLKEHFECAGKRVLIAHYADYLKFICKTYMGWNGEKDEAGRTLLQHVGTDVIRKNCPDFWVSFMLLMLRMSEDLWDYVIIADCRFPNEIDLLKNALEDVVHVRVERPGFSGGLTEEQSNHPSETALNNVVPDHVLMNDGTKEDLRASIAVLAEIIE